MSKLLQDTVVEGLAYGSRNLAWSDKDVVANLSVITNNWSLTEEEKDRAVKNYRRAITILARERGEEPRWADQDVTAPIAELRPR